MLSTESARPRISRRAVLARAIALRGIRGFVLVIAVLCSSRLTAWAQLPTPNPLVAPIPRPSSTPQAASTDQALPSLVATPTPVASVAAPAARAFNCSCFGPGVGTRWMGSVEASGYFAARQAATGACLSYNQRKEPEPPTLATHKGGSFAPALTLPQGFENPNAGASPALPDTSFNTSTMLASCSQCVCD